MRSRALDRPRLHVPRHAQPLGVSPIPHLMQLTDGDVVALAVLHAGISEVAEQQHDHNHRRPEFEISLRLTGHGTPRRHRACMTLIFRKLGIKISQKDFHSSELVPERHASIL